jgi:hypothetical protein
MTFGTLYDNVSLQSPAAEVAGVNTDARACLVRERDAHVRVLDDHVTRYHLGDRDGIWRLDDSFVNVKVRAPVEEVRASELQSLDIGDGRREQEVVAGYRPVVPFLLARERGRQVARVQRMARPADGAAVEAAIRSAEQDGGGKFAFFVRHRCGGHVCKDTPPPHFPKGGRENLGDTPGPAEAGSASSVLPGARYYRNSSTE